MIFLIEYDRAAGLLIQLTAFDDGLREQAENARLALELALNRSMKTHEVVLLEARDEAALHRTHQRYFESMSGILATSGLLTARLAEAQP